MRIYNRLIITLAIAFGVINTFLAFMGQNDISVYFIVNTLVYLIITVLYVYLNPRARAALNGLTAIVFTGFMVIVALNVIEILS